MAGIPSTATRTDHAMTIKANSQVIGLIQEWQPAQSRTVTPTYMLAKTFDNSKDASYGRGTYWSGEIYEQVPGNIGGLTITVNRFDLFKSRMEEVWGQVSVNNFMLMLTDQTTGIEVDEVWNNPDGSTESYTYHRCWFTSLGRTHSATGDRIVKVNATLQYSWKSYSSV